VRVFRFIVSSILISCLGAASPGVATPGLAAPKQEIRNLDFKSEGEGCHRDREDVLCWEGLVEFTQRPEVIVCYSFCNDAHFVIFSLKN
jgi:hypothetical protein